MFRHRPFTRSRAARMIREEAAALAARHPDPAHLSNGEEAEFHNAAGLNYIANYSKGLCHNTVGEVVPANYQALLRALYSGNPDHFEQIPLGTVGGRKLNNPQAGLAFDLEGPDAQSLTIRPAPRIDSPEVSGEMAELYWMALLRDVSFIDYGTGANTDGGPNKTADAVSSLNNDFTDFRGPKVKTLLESKVTIGTLFRGSTLGDLIGPYLSQFLLRGNDDSALGLLPQNGFIKFGTLLIDQRQKTAMPGVDYLTRFERPPAPQPRIPNWRDVQNGVDQFVNTGGTFDLIGSDQFDPTRRFIRSLRDLATYVHFDALYEAYLNACLILLNMKAPFDPGNPYVRSVTQDGFGTFGGPHILSLLTEVATRALKAVWFQKWGVHRRLRPEEFGGLIHVHLKGLPALSPNRPMIPPLTRYPMIDREILNTAPGSVLARINQHNNTIPLVDDTHLLPLAFPEGCPTHPAYGAGHATVAGACVAILKAWFDESFVIPNPLQADRDGLNLIPAALPAGVNLTVGGELNKLAANIALGRNGAGVHWRSDYTESIKLGEAIAIGILEEQNLTYNEDYYLTLTKFDGSAITIGR